MVHDQSGQSLVEMIVIVGMVVLLVTGIVAGTTASLSRSETSRTRSDALTLAQAGIELTRGQRDNGWAAFAALGDPPTTTVTTIDTTFTRSVKLELIPANGTSPIHMKVTSRVVWGDTTNLSNAVQLITYLTQWK